MGFTGPQVDRAEENGLNAASGETVVFGDEDVGRLKGNGSGKFKAEAFFMQCPCSNERRGHNSSKWITPNADNPLDVDKFTSISALTFAF